MIFSFLMMEFFDSRLTVIDETFKRIRKIIQWTDDAMNLSKMLFMSFFCWDRKLEQLAIEKQAKEHAKNRSDKKVVCKKM